MIFLKNEIVLFTDGDINIEVELSPELETVWLTQKQMGELFEVKQATLSEHINNIISSGELDETSIGFSDKSSSIGCDYAYDCRVKTRRKRYNGESCNEFFDNVVSSWNLIFNEIGKSEFTGSVTRKPKRYTGKKIKKRIKSWF